ncbi:Cytochrome P450 71B35 [Frankliniella fusca]|uniref:Cytochrome P450 71B35 n=1 Tax=Frankliniella fusca TaxID=407009 RepID=A0AAE1LER0_9NEOP|nr:Cytochrome P450 71B35 [Frankliniella fusca]KAK3926565.1 Cytochrome P450 71B35 [Frankliniella fusca]
MVKVLIGISPSGLISFISQTYAAQIPYAQIFKDSELVSKNLIDPYNDAIMVNKSLDVHDVCDEMAIRVLCPSAFHSIFDNVKDSSDKLKPNFVSGVKGRLEMFQILKAKLFPCLIPFVNDIIIVVADMFEFIHGWDCKKLAQELRGAGLEDKIVDNLEG